MMNIAYRIIWYPNHFFYPSYLLNTDIHGGCDQQLSNDHQKFMSPRRTKLTAPETISFAEIMVENRRLNLPHLIGARVWG